jgi:hypothetical protein
MIAQAVAVSAVKSVGADVNLITRQMAGGIKTKE